MSSQTSSEMIDDLNLLMCIAIFAGKQGIDIDSTPIFQLWELEFPHDALGKVGRGLSLVKEGDLQGGYNLIQEAVKFSTSRTDQAKDILKTMSDGFGEQLKY